MGYRTIDQLERAKFWGCAVQTCFEAAMSAAASGANIEHSETNSMSELAVQTADKLLAAFDERFPETEEDDE